MKSNDAYANLVRCLFPDHIRLSIHAHSNVEKVGITLVKMAPESDILWGTPWHNCAVLKRTGTYFFFFFLLSLVLLLLLLHLLLLIFFQVNGNYFEELLRKPKIMNYKMMVNFLFSWKRKPRNRYWKKRKLKFRLKKKFRRKFQEAR